MKNYRATEGGRGGTVSWRRVHKPERALRVTPLSKVELVYQRMTISGGPIRTKLSRLVCPADPAYAFLITHDAQGRHAFWGREGVGSGVRFGFVGGAPRKMEPGNRTRLR